MEYKQLVSPNLATKDLPGWCLRFTGNAFATKPRPFDRARKAWEGAKYKHTDALPNVAVPVFFTWWGYIDGEYDNWADVAIWVPGKGVLGTPLQGSGVSQRWDDSVQTRARNIGGKYKDGSPRPAQYLGWTEDLNTVRLVQPIVKTNPQEQIEMIANTDQANKMYKLLRPNGAGSAGEISATAGHRTFAEFINTAQPEVAVRDQLDREKNVMITALQNDLKTLKLQADELAKRPTQSAFDKLHENLTVCSDGATQQQQHIMELEKDLAFAKAKPEGSDLFEQFESFYKKVINKMKGILK